MLNLPVASHLYQYAASLNMSTLRSSLEALDCRVLPYIHFSQTTSLTQQGSWGRTLSKKTQVYLAKEFKLAPEIWKVSTVTTVTEAFSYSGLHYLLLCKLLVPRGPNKLSSLRLIYVVTSIFLKSDGMLWKFVHTFVLPLGYYSISVRATALLETSCGNLYLAVKL